LHASGEANPKDPKQSDRPYLRYPIRRLTSSTLLGPESTSASGATSPAVPTRPDTKNKRNDKVGYVFRGEERKGVGQTYQLVGIQA
jgi:hypothetical protein